MNVTIPEKAKYSLKDKIIYTTVILASVLCLFAIIYVEVSADTSISEMLDTKQTEEKSLGKKTEEEKEVLKAEINSKFTNSVEKKSDSSNVQNIKKIDENSEIVFTSLQTKESKPGSYEVNVVLPIININSDTVKGYNKEIESVFKNELQKVMESKNKNIVYTTEYVSSINDDILSIMIRANLKEGSSAQRTIIKTYNYDIVQNKEVSLSEMLSKNNLDKNEIQKSIKEEIEKSQSKVEALKEAGYTIYSRNPSDSKYNIDNAKQFYCTSNTIYIVYAYGNDESTSEVDVVVI